MSADATATMGTSVNGLGITTPRDENFELVLRGNGSKISAMYREPIIIPERTHIGYIGLKSFSFYNNICNVISNKNNQLKIFIPNEDEKEEPIEHIFTLEAGAYEIAQVNSSIQTWIIQNHPRLAKTVKDDFVLLGNRATQKCEFHIRKEGYGVDFNVDYSIHKLLGYQKTDIFKSKGRFVASNIADICPVSAILFNTNISQSNFINGIESPYLYCSPLSVPPGFRLFKQIENISYKRLTTNTISQLTCWLTDQLNREVDILSDELVVVLSLKLERILKRVETIAPHHS
jgi:hypothetical protein